jgi:Tfp pilus assembly protein PilF
MAARYYDRATHGEYLEPADLEQAVIQLKWALETDPSSADAHYNLGVVYESIGCYSEAVREFQRALAMEPDRRLAAAGLEGAWAKLSRHGDRVEPRRLPRTPFEQARGLQQVGRLPDAERIYLDLIRRDPFHFPAYERLAALYSSSGDHAAANGMLERGAKARRRLHVANPRPGTP